MSQLDEKFAPFKEKMKSEDLPDIIIKRFKHYYKLLVEGHTGLIPESDIQPIESLPDAEKLPKELAERGKSALSKSILLKLNGGLGTSMGLDKAKSLLTVKNGLSFLDVIARQAIHRNIPLVLMNSFNTHRDSLQALEKYPDLQGEIPLDFVQHKVPKVKQADLQPVEWHKNPDLEWCPAGHGDIYTSLVTSGMLDKLLNAGYQYAFVSNADNLGAVMDSYLLGHFIDQNLPFMMEVADRTEADKKGGHIAQLPSGQLILRESAQCPDEDMDEYQNVSKHKYFNTNNLWINLNELKKVMEEKENILGLPMIRNSKTVDPRDPDSTPVYQLETAMGAAIGAIENAGAIRVPRTRFAPVKNTNDLLAVRSDIYQLTEDYRVVPNPDRNLGTIVIDMDSKFYKMNDDMEARFPKGTPSLIDCKSLTIEGDVKFGENIKLKEDVHLINSHSNQVEIPDQSVISGEWRP